MCNPGERVTRHERDWKHLPIPTFAITDAIAAADPTASSVQRADLLCSVR
jgi:hypothetical protein